MSKLEIKEQVKEQLGEIKFDCCRSGFDKISCNLGQGSSKNKGIGREVNGEQCIVRFQSIIAVF